MPSDVSHVYQMHGLTACCKRWERSVLSAWLQQWKQAARIDPPPLVDSSDDDDMPAMRWAAIRQAALYHFRHHFHVQSALYHFRR